MLLGGKDGNNDRLVLVLGGDVCPEKTNGRDGLTMTLLPSLHRNARSFRDRYIPPSSLVCIIVPSMYYYY
jgi:hypothetical protein